MQTEQAGFRSGHSTVEQIANVIILNENYIKHQGNNLIYNKFIAFEN